jgi:hypothetical protein
VKMSPTMQRVISAIATRHGLNLAELGAALTLELPGYMRLAIEVIGKGRLSVAHYYEQYGDLVADPDVELLILSPELWMPYAITQLGRYRNDAAGQAALADFCEFWARNLEAQGWASEWARRRGEGDDAAALAA